LLGREEVAGAFLSLFHRYPIDIKKRKDPDDQLLSNLLKFKRLIQDLMAM